MKLSFTAIKHNETLDIIIIITLYREKTNNNSFMHSYFFITKRWMGGQFPYLSCKAI